MERRRSGRRNTKPKKSWKQKCKDCLRQFFAFLFSNVGIICLVIGYTLAGAVMFMKIEGKKEGEMDDEYNFWNKLNTSYNETLEHLWNIASVTWFSENGVNFLNRTEDELKKFQAVVVNGVKISDYDGGSIYKDRWSIYAAFLYCLTVITTIGKLVFVLIITTMLLILKFFLSNANIFGKNRTANEFIYQIILRLFY